MISQQNDKFFPEELSYGDIRKELNDIIDEILELKRSKIKNGKRRMMDKNELGRGVQAMGAVQREPGAYAPQEKHKE